MKILVAYDRSPCADAAIDDMQRAGLPVAAETLILCVAGGELPASTESDTKGWQHSRSQAETVAGTAANRLQSCFPQWKISAESLWGWPPNVILELSQTWQPDLLVVGSRGRSPFTRLFLGSVSVEMVHKAACSVRVARTGISDRKDNVRIR